MDNGWNRCVARTRPECCSALTRRVLDIGIDQRGRARSRPVKVQQRTSGGCWRTPQGLADFAVIQSYLSTATKWGIDAPDALIQLFIEVQLFFEGPWLPAAIRPG